MKKTALSIAFSVLLLSAMIAPVMAGPTDVVVQVGDWFKYERKVTEWGSTDPFLPEGYFGPLSLADNQTNYVLYTVTEIMTVTEPAAGKNVTFLVTYNWKNGSETSETIVEHVSTANQNIFMIGANMEAPQMVSETYDFLGMGFYQYPARYINRTFDFTNPIATRATNELNYTIDIMGSIYNYTMRWDKATGMRIYYEEHGDAVAFGEYNAYKFTRVHELVDSSVADLLYVPEVFTTIVMLLIISASTASIVLYRRKKLFI